MGNLRGVLTNLRQVLGDTLTITRDEAGINPEAEVWLDSFELEDSLSAIRRQGKLNADTARQAASALELYKGEFLQGFTVFDCRGFEDWSVRERERLHHLAVDGFSELVIFEIEQKEYQLGMAHAARLLELDPLMESAHRQMMQLLAPAVNGQLPSASTRPAGSYSRMSWGLSRMKRHASSTSRSARVHRHQGRARPATQGHGHLPVR